MLGHSKDFLKYDLILFRIEKYLSFVDVVTGNTVRMSKN